MEKTKGMMDMERVKEWYHDTFFGTPYGKYVLTSILQNLGYFETDERSVDPKMTAFANRLLLMCGVFGCDGDSQFDMVGRFA